MGSSKSSSRFSRSIFTLGFLFLFFPGSGFFLWSLAPSVAWLNTTNPRETSLMHFQEEKQLRLGMPAGRTWRWVPLSHISPYLIQSVIAAEDRLFFGHKGFNWEYLWEAFKYDIKSGQIVKGGSSITQQVAKNLFLEPSRTVSRKLREALITYRLERELTKERILEIYLNIVEWGPGIYGVDAAAQTYFGKSAAELSLPESVRLASALPNPRLYRPMDSENESLRRHRRVALMYMLQQNWISKASYVQALEEMFSLHDSRRSETSTPREVPPPALPPKLLTPDYWIAKLPDPDKVIMTAREIQQFNKRALIMSGGTDIFGLPDTVPGKEVSDRIVESARLSFFFSPVSGGGPGFFSGNPAARTNPDTMPDYPEYYDRSNILTGRFYSRLMKELNIRALPRKSAVRYAVAVRDTTVLNWPEDRLVMSSPYTYELNRNQQGTLCSGVPAAVLHASQDGGWLFVRTPYLDGWVKAGDLARTTRGDALAYPGPDFLVVTAPLVRTASGKDLSLGSRVRLLRNLPGGYEIAVPVRAKNGTLELAHDYLNSVGVRGGFLPYTKRNVIAQAFKLLDRPFGWGKTRSGWDCSAYIQDTFSVFGIQLPRNSAWQVKASEEVAVFDELFDTGKADTITRSTPAVTLLWLPGHIMLYLGEDGGKPYAIHALYGVKDNDNNLIKVNKITVTGLDLGGKDRSLLDRVKCAGGIYLSPSDFQGLCKSFFGWFFSNKLLTTLGSVVAMLVTMESAFFIFGARVVKKKRGE